MQKELDLHDLSLLHNKSISIARIDDEYCIYKQLDISEDKTIVITHRRNWFYQNSNYKLYLDIIESNYSGNYESYKLHVENISIDYHIEGRYTNEALITLNNVLFYFDNGFRIRNYIKYKDGAALVGNVPITFINKTLALSDTLVHLKDLLENTEQCLQIFNSLNITTEVKNSDGVKNTLNKIQPFLDNLSTNLRKATVYILLEEITKSTKGIKNSVIFNKLFNKLFEVDDFNRLIDKLELCLLKAKNYHFYENYLNEISAEFPNIRELRKDKLKKNQTKAFNKVMEDVDFIDINAEKYPITFDKIQTGEIPLGTFFRKQLESYFLYNDNWELWERFIQRFPEESVELAKEVSKRTTYEKDIMSYMYFVLDGLPQYLEKYTGKKWTCEPKLVTSANELEPPKIGDNGVTKKRSALTPIVDNEKCHIIVPYVSMSVGGARTQY